MPLNHEIGEIVEGMDDIFRVSPIEKWQQQTRLTTIVEEMSTGKFKRPVKKVKMVWLAAFEYAQRAFYNSGASGKIIYDAIAQEYPRTGILTFVFCSVVNGQELFVTAPFKLTDQQIADLTLRNLWQPYTVN
jgi:hypothetical protein